MAYSRSDCAAHAAPVALFYINQLISYSMSTITVPDELRRRVKRLASLLDVPQHKVLEMLLDLFERDLIEESTPEVSPKVREELARARALVESEDPGWAERSRRLEEAVASGLSPALFRGRWGVELKDNA